MNSRDPFYRRVAYFMPQVIVPTAFAETFKHNRTQVSPEFRSVILRLVLADAM